MDPKAMDLPVKLTPEEREINTKLLGQLIADVRSTEAAKKRAADEFKTKLEHLASEITRRGDIAATGEERRTVPVVGVKDFASKTMRIYRTDTNEEVDSRPLEFEEMQQNLLDEAAESTVTRVKSRRGKATEHRASE